MNKAITDNYNRLRLSLLFLPLLLAVLFVLFLYVQGALNAGSYIQVQKHSFFFLNAELSQFPNTIYNLTQIGDALIFLSLLAIFIVYAPVIWEALITASLVSLLFSSSLKNLFSVPRPAAVFDHHSFVIIGRALPGHSSLPSGHSITVFTSLTVLLFAFMPQKLGHKIIWILLLTIIGLILVFTRVGVGAHYPLDVIAGSIVGYTSALIGIFISRKYRIWSWVNNRKYYPVFFILLPVCCYVLITKIINENLPVFYLALASLIISLYKITDVYIKK